MEVINFHQGQHHFLNSLDSKVIGQVAEGQGVLGKPEK